MDKLVVGILTVSDRSYREERIDLSGPALEEFSIAHNWKVLAKKIVSDDPEQIELALLDFLTLSGIDLILTTGGTGLSPRDNTPEVTERIIEKKIPGLTELMRSQSYSITPNSMLSRAVAGIARNKLIINLPGSPSGTVENLSAIAELIPHAVSQLKGQDNHS